MTLVGLEDCSCCVREEIFGLVCHVASFVSESEAVRCPNDTGFGRSQRLDARRRPRASSGGDLQQVGKVWVNNWQHRHPMSPLAGQGRSGLGTAFGEASLAFCSEATTVTVRIEPDIGA